MSKISAYPALTSTTSAASDLLAIVDVRDTSEAPTGTTKNVTVSTLMDTMLGWTNVVTEFGADPTETNDSTTAIQNAVNSLAAAGGVLYFPTGRYKITSTVTCTTRFITFQGDGQNATVLVYYGTGDCLRVYNTDTTGIITNVNLRDLTISGIHAIAPATGLHYGDQRSGEFDFAIWNFTGAGSIGLHLDNQYAWTEECHGFVHLNNNTNSVVFDVSGNLTSTNSFGYSDFYFEILSKINQNSIVVQNGAFVYHSTLKVKANHAGDNVTNQTSAFLTITGRMPAGHPDNNFSIIKSSHLEFVAEKGAGTAIAPATIIFGSATNNVIANCEGIMDFTTGGGTFSSAVNFLGSFAFDGPVLGDVKLWRSQVGVANFNAADTLSSGQNILPYSEIYTISPSSDLSGMIIARWPAAMGVPVRFTVINAGPGMITMDIQSVSHVSNGTACVIQPNTAQTFSWNPITSFWYPG